MNARTDAGAHGLHRSACSRARAEAKARNARGEPPPILLVHGDQDPLIPLEAMFATMDDLARAGLPNQWHLSFGVGHGIDAGGLTHGGLFLAQSFRAAAR